MIIYMCVCHKVMSILLEENTVDNEYGLESEIKVSTSISQGLSVLTLPSILAGNTHTYI